MEPDVINILGSNFAFNASNNNYIDSMKVDFQMMQVGPQTFYQVCVLMTESVHLLAKKSIILIGHREPQILKNTKKLELAEILYVS